MATPEVHHLFHAPIADHSFSSDKKTLAVARENNVELYQQSGNKFTLSDELKGHEKTVTSVDIAPNSGRIVTCSQGMLWQSPFYYIPYTIPNRCSLYRSQCLRLGANPHRMETYSGPSPNQPCRNLCALVPIGAEVRRRLRRSSDCSLLLRGGERLVDLEAHQEAYSQYYYNPGMAPELRPAGSRIDRFSRPSLLKLHQGYRYPPGA